jgi:hypothetical protein
MRNPLDLSVAVFIVALLATFVVSYLGRRHANRVATTTLAGHRLNRWLGGLERRGNC